MTPTVGGVVWVDVKSRFQTFSTLMFSIFNSFPLCVKKVIKRGFTSTHSTQHGARAAFLLARIGCRGFAAKDARQGWTCRSFQTVAQWTEYGDCCTCRAGCATMVPASSPIRARAAGSEEPAKKTITICPSLAVWIRLRVSTLHPQGAGFFAGYHNGKQRQARNLDERRR